MAEREPSHHIVHTHLTPLERWRHLIEIAAFVIAAAWAFYVFVYQERIKPAMEAPSLEVTPTLSHAPMATGKELVTAGLEMRNIGAVALQFDAVVLNVYGVRFGSRTAPTSSSARGSLTISNVLPKTQKLLFARFVTYAPFGDTTRISNFAPGREKHFYNSFAIPQRAYDAIEVDLAFCYQRQDDTRVRHFTPPRGPDGGFQLMQVVNQNGQDLYCGVE